MHINNKLHEAQRAHQAGELAEALRLYESVLDQSPVDFTAWCQGACVALEIGALELNPLAVSWAQQAIELRPKEAYAHYVLGLAYQQAGQVGEAVASYVQAIALQETFYQAHTNLGVAYNTQREFQKAQLSLERAIELDPSNALALNNLGVTFRSLGQLERAIECFDHAVALNPQYWDALVNRGFAKSECMRIDSAMEDYLHVLQFLPNHAPAQFNLSMMQLMRGDFDAGWLGYEARHRLQGSETPEFQDSRLNPGAFKACTLMSNDAQNQPDKKPLIEVVSEQGFGDVIQFCRYVDVLADLGFRVRLKAPAPLHSLLSGLKGLDALVLPNHVLGPEVDCSVPMMSLPWLLGTQLSTIPAQTPYLYADPLKVQYFQEQISNLLDGRDANPVQRKMRIGLVWSGGFRAQLPQTWELNARRNIPLEVLEPLGKIDADFFTLQVGEPAQSELAALMASGWRGPQLIDLTPWLHDFSDTAALMMQLDLILSVDTACAHLAGALGKEVWIMNRHDACWRWLIAREDSPWYPGAKLYRQSRSHDWTHVVQQVFTDLDDRVSSFEGKVIPCCQTTNT
jgi:hypothetical protein